MPITLSDLLALDGADAMGNALRRRVFTQTEEDTACTVSPVESVTNLAEGFTRIAPSHDAARRLLRALTDTGTDSEAQLRAAHLSVSRQIRFVSDGAIHAAWCKIQGIHTQAFALGPAVLIREEDEIEGTYWRIAADLPGLFHAPIRYPAKPFVLSAHARAAALGHPRHGRHNAALIALAHITAALPQHDERTLLAIADGVLLSALRDSPPDHALRRVIRLHEDACSDRFGPYPAGHRAGEDDAQLRRMLDAALHTAG